MLSGNINLSQFVVQSEAFQARTQGAIPIALVLTNSPLNLPVEFALRRHDLGGPFREYLKTLTL